MAKEIIAVFWGSGNVDFSNIVVLNVFNVLVTTVLLSSHLRVLDFIVLTLPAYEYSSNSSKYLCLL